MKKILLSIALVLCAAVNAQNIQLHYDLGKHLYNTEEHERQDVTVTYETFKADNLGSWYYFIDADVDKDGISCAYTELSREFNIGKSGLAAHVEFDGGLVRGGSIKSAALVGAAWNGHNADFSTTYSVQLMYKQFFGQKKPLDGNTHAYASVQCTGVWSTTFANDKLTFSGFIDLWRGEKFNKHGQLVLLAEPQLWYNVSKKVSFGTEVEVSNNFITNLANNKTFFINPTLACKFNL